MGLNKHHMHNQKRGSKFIKNNEEKEYRSPYRTNHRKVHGKSKHAQGLVSILFTYSVAVYNDRKLSEIKSFIKFVKSIDNFKLKITGEKLLVPKSFYLSQEEVKEVMDDSNDDTSFKRNISSVLKKLLLEGKLNNKLTIDIKFTNLDIEILIEKGFTSEEYEQLEDPETFNPKEDDMWSIPHSYGGYADGKQKHIFNKEDDPSLSLKLVAKNLLNNIKNPRINE